MDEWKSQLYEALEELKQKLTNIIKTELESIDINKIIDDMDHAQSSVTPQS